MIDRLRRQMFRLLLGLFVLSFLFGIVRYGGTVAVASITHLIPTLLAGFVGTVMTGILLMGLVVRVHQLLTGHGSRAGRDHGARERQVRLTVRRLAEGVPAVSGPELPADPDPAISMEDQ